MGIGHVKNLVDGNHPVPDTVGPTVVKQTKHKHLALSVTLVVIAVLLVLASLVALFLLPHLGVHVSPLFGLLAIPILVGLVKMAVAIFLLHKPEKKVIEKEIVSLEDQFIAALDEKGKKHFYPLEQVLQKMMEDGTLEQEKRVSGEPVKNKSQSPQVEKKVEHKGSGSDGNNDLGSKQG